MRRDGKGKNPALSCAKTIRKVVATWHSLYFTGYTCLTERILEIWPPSEWILPRR